MPYIVLVKLSIFRAILTFWNFPDPKKLRFPTFETSASTAFADFLPHASRTAHRHQSASSPFSYATGQILLNSDSAPMAILRFTIDTPRACLAIPETTIHSEAFLNTYHLHLHRQSETGQNFSFLQLTGDRKSETPETPRHLNDCLHE